MVELQPSIEIIGIRIQEPVTTFTDLIVASVCFWAFNKMRKDSRNQLLYSYVKYFFLVMGFATFIGGIVGHAFLYLTTFAWKLPGWILSMLSVALLERAAIQHTRPLLKSHIGNFFMVLNVIELIIFIFIVVYTLNFTFVEVHAAYGLLIVVFCFELNVYLKTKDKGSLLMLVAVAILTVAAIIHMIKFSFSQWFNYFDIGHVLMAVACYLIYRGIKESAVVPSKV